MRKVFTGMIMTIFFLLLLAASCSKEEDEPRTREKEWEELDAMIKELEAEGLNVDTTALSIFYITRRSGTGPFPKAGDTCSVSYYGFYLPQGIEFENSRDIHPP
jgi:FKBP-type peptidyl-prolyl cis-trans isomerase